jgi:hypothetical protein
MSNSRRFIKNGKRYRVVSPIKFITANIIIPIIAAVLIYGVVYNMIVGVKVGYQYVSSIFKSDDVEKDVTLVSENYEFKLGDIDIHTDDKEVYIELLESNLMDYAGRVYKLGPNEESIDQHLKVILKDDYDLYTEYRYALEFGTSDMTVSDLKMIIEYCKKYNVNPHLWLNLVELESGYYSKASGGPSKGWGQVIPSTGRWLYEDVLKLGKYNHDTMSIDKEINTNMSTYYLSSLIQNHGVRTALLRYNGYAIGERYVNLISAKLKKNAGLTLDEVKNFNT